MLSEFDLETLECEEAEGEPGCCLLEADDQTTPLATWCRERKSPKETHRQDFMPLHESLLSLISKGTSLWRNQVWNLQLSEQQVSERPGEEVRD